MEDHYPLPPDPDKPQANGKPNGASKRQRGGKSNGVQKQGRKRARKKKDIEYDEAEEETPNGEQNADILNDLANHQSHRSRTAF